jgi:hypothetical protein
MNPDTRQRIGDIALVVTGIATVGAWLFICWAGC